MKRITVVLVDDNRVVRKEIRGILERDEDMEVVGEAKDGRGAVAVVKKARPEVVLMDVAMPVLNGLQATRKIVEALPGAKVIMLSAHGDEAYVEEAKRCGAVGYLLKQTCVDAVHGAIKRVLNGEKVFSVSKPRRLRQSSWRVLAGAWV